MISLDLSLSRCLVAARCDCSWSASSDSPSPHHAPDARAVTAKVLTYAVFNSKILPALTTCAAAARSAVSTRYQINGARPAVSNWAVARAINFVAPAPRPRTVRWEVAARRALTVMTASASVTAHSISRKAVTVRPREFADQVAASQVIRVFTITAARPRKFAARYAVSPARDAFAVSAAHSNGLAVQSVTVPTSSSFRPSCATRSVCSRPFATKSPSYAR